MEFDNIKAKGGGFAELRVSVDGAVTMTTAESAGQSIDKGSAQLSLQKPPPMAGWVELEANFVRSKLVRPSLLVSEPLEVLESYLAKQRAFLKASQI